MAAVERRAGISFQADLRRYLLEVSDVAVGVLEPVTIGGGHTDFEEVLCCVAPSEEVVFWSHDGPTDERWPDLATWISDVWIAGRSTTA